MMGARAWISDVFVTRLFVARHLLKPGAGGSRRSRLRHPSPTTNSSVPGRSPSSEYPTMTQESLEVSETDFLVPLDTALVQRIITSYPFQQIEGTLNFRDIGGLPIAASPDLMTRPGIIYRSGQISAITDKGKQQFTNLHIATVFDMRSLGEMEQYAAPVATIPGVEIVHSPVFDDKAFTPEEMARRHMRYGEGKEGFLDAYRDILNHGGPTFVQIVRRILSRPDGPVLYHCAVGKDRTGILSALLLMIAGVADDYIIYDYSLTRVGLDVARNRILAHMGSLLTTDPEACSTMLGSRASYMREILDLIRAEYGGADIYLTKYGKLRQDELEAFRKLFVVPRAVS